MTKDLVVFRCKGCIKDLKEHNPYIYPDGTSVPLEKIEIVEVPHEFCENNEANMHHHPQLQTPILLNTKTEYPWAVKFWETEDDRENGISTIFDTFEDFKAAKAEAVATARVCSWASAEIYLKTAEREVVVYFYDGEKPRKSSFVKHTEVEK